MTAEARVDAEDTPLEAHTTSADLPRATRQTTSRAYANKHTHTTPLTIANARRTS